jgi:hypothetical protein
MRFKEIEHKFVVDASFDLAGFRSAVGMLRPAPVRVFALRVRDRYFLTGHGRSHRYVIRHRYDEELHHLTIKALETDPEVRDEINLDLGQHAGDQEAAVDAFVARLGSIWQGDVVKDIEVWEFADCELVHYRAAGGGRDVRCVEFEAKHAATIDDAVQTLGRYERATGFGSATRTMGSLVDLLFPGALDRAEA